MRSALQKWITLGGMGFLLLSCAAGHHGDLRVLNSDIRTVMLTQPQSFFHVDTAAYPRHDKNLPIGMFDSGSGGLTVLDAVVNFDGFDNEDHTPRGDGIADFSREKFIYLGDQANMPYGDYALEDNLPLLKEHIFKDLQFLLGSRYYRTPASKEPERDKLPVKAIVIACNTATAFGKKDIEAFMDHARLPVKVIGVIDAGVRGALVHLRPSEDGAIAVMATPGTVSSKGYPQALREQMAALGYSGHIEIFQQPGHGLAGAIDGEGAFLDHEATAPRAQYKGPALAHAHAVIDATILHRYGFDYSENRMLIDGASEAPRALQINAIENYIAYNLVSLLEQLRRAPTSPPLKVIILGCTHYPFYEEVFRAKLAALYDYQEQGLYVYRPCMAAEIVLVDPAIHTARELYEHLEARQLLADNRLAQSAFFISVPNRDNPAVVVDAAGNFTWDYKYGRRAGEIQEYVKCVPFSRETVPLETQKRLQRSIPKTHELIELFMGRGN